MTEPVSSTAAGIALLKQLVPGLVGGVISLRFIKIDGTFNKVASVIGGAAVAYYFAEPVASYFGLKSEVMGFGLGLFGMSIIAKVFETIENIKAQGLADWITDLLPTRKGGE